MQVNVSAILNYISCPSKWFIRYVAQRGNPKGEGAAIRFGNRWHDMCEAGRFRYDPRDTPQERLQLRLGWWALQRELREWDIRILERELTLTAPLGEHELIGRLDALVQWNNQHWHLQYKTTAQATNIDFFQRMVARSYHEAAYRELASANDYQPYGGTILVCLRKLSRAAIKRGEPLLVLLPVAVPHRPGAINELLYYVSRMTLFQKTPLKNDPERFIDLQCIPQNPTACDGYWHSPGTACPYLDVCEGLAPCDSLPHDDPLSRYKEPHNEEA
jgi:hypothetical protein